MENTYKLSDILFSVKQLIQECFYDDIWVEAELSDWKINKFSGHAYGELVEHDSKGKKMAACRFTCWKYKVFEINSVFKNLTGESIKSGIKVRLQIKLSFSEIYGFSANILDIDPRFTLGDLQANIQDILKKLADKKIDQQNQSLENPFDYFNVSVISSPNAAGLEDFKQIANSLESDGLCVFNYIDALMQGEECASSVIKALNKVKALQVNTAQDCVVILRGGGSILDLASFNNYDLSEAVCTFPLPVFCAIGHEKDQSVIDIIANKSFGTPSKAAQFIEKTILNNAKEMIQFYDNIHRSVTEALNLAATQLQNFSGNITKSVEYHLDKATQSLFEKKKNIDTDIINLLVHSQVSVEHAYKLVLANSVEQTLKKGYCVVKNKGGVVLTKNQADNMGVQSLLFHDGEYQLWQN